ncbi:MAG: DUF2863 family protein [Bacillota bacterium]
MQKNKHPSRKTHTPAAPDQDDALTQSLVTLSAGLARHIERTELPEPVKRKKADLLRLVRKCLQQKKDDVLDEALERLQDDDSNGYHYLKNKLEEASENAVFRRDGGPDLEVDAFVIPLFARTAGGLRREQCFQDEKAFEQLRNSLIDAQLESRHAKLVLVSHAYHLDEIDRIGYSQLHGMVREAFDAMTRKKVTDAPEIARSISGWPENRFAPEDSAVELRFLLGFSLKALDDPFYRVPDNEAAADRYFAARAARFRQWAQQYAPLVKRCLVRDGREIEIDFLYQDLFYGGKETALAEYFTLQMMADMQHALQEHGLAPEDAQAVLGPAHDAGETVLRVNLYAQGNDTPLVSSDKPLGSDGDLRAETDDACDALATLGIQSVALATKFDADGRPVDVRPYRPA